MLPDNFIYIIEKKNNNNTKHNQINFEMDRT